MTTSSSYEKKWLIKSDQKISGPFSYEQIEEQLRKKQISLIDEIRDMERRWSFIREVPELKDLVEMVRKEVDSSSELTQTVQTKAHQETQSITRKELTVTKEPTATKDLNREQTVTPVPEHLIIQNDVSVEENQSPSYQEGNTVIDVQFKENLADRNQIANQQQKNRVTRFGTAADYSVQQEIKTDRSKYLIGFGAFLLASLLGYVGFNYNKQIEAQRLDNEIVNQIKKFAMNGNNDKVVDAFSKAPAHLRRRALPDVINYFPLLQNYDVSTKDDFIGRLKLEVTSKPKKALIDMFLFHRSMSMKDFASANAFLTTAKDYDPTSEIVLENEAIYSLTMEKYKEAIAQFGELLKKEVKGRWLIGQLMAQFKMGEFVDAKAQQDVIDKYLITQTRMDYKRELLLFQIYLSKKENNKRFYEHSMRDYIDAPTQFTTNFRVDPLIWMPGYDSRVYESLYQAIMAKQKGFEADKLTLAFISSYALENQNYSGVQEFLKSSSMESSNPDKVNINFQYLMIQGRKMEAMALLKSSGVENLNSYSQFLVFKNLTENKSLKDNYSEFFKRSSEILDQEKNFFTLYAQFINLKNSSSPDDKNKLREFLDLNMSTNADFSPFLIAKGDLN